MSCHNIVVCVFASQCRRLQKNHFTWRAMDKNRSVATLCYCTMNCIAISLPYSSANCLAELWATEWGEKSGRIYVSTVVCAHIVGVVRAMAMIVLYVKYASCSIAEQATWGRETVCLPVLLCVCVCLFVCVSRQAYRVAVRMFWFFLSTRAGERSLSINIRLLTLSNTVMSDGYTSKCSGPYCCNPPFLFFFDIWALWRSVVSAMSARVSKIIKGWVRPVWRWTLW